MSEDLRQLGAAARAFLKGLLEEEAAGRTQRTDVLAANRSAPLLESATSRGTLRAAWARVLDVSEYPELYEGEPEAVKREGAIPPAAVHNVRIKTTDVFYIPSMGTFTVPFEGFSRVACSDPTTDDWETAIVYVNYLEHKLFGTHPELGDITVDLNPQVASGGNIFTPFRAFGATHGGSRRPAEAKACRVNIGATFRSESLGKTLFNKTPIQIASDDLRGVPPLNEGGTANVFSLPLYDLANENGDIAAFIEHMHYKVLGYIPKAELDKHREAGSFQELRALTGGG